MAPLTAAGGGGNIKVVVRVRPFNGRGTSEGCRREPVSCVDGGGGRRIADTIRMQKSTAAHHVWLR